MTRTEKIKTAKVFNMLADEYVTRARRFRIEAEKAGSWGHSRVRNHWLSLMRCALTFIVTGQEALK